MKRCLLAALTLLLIGSLALASERAASLLNSFQVMCTLGDLDFAASDAKAAAMHLPVRKDLHQGPDANGYYAKSKSWLLPLKDGQHEFVVTEGRGPKGEVKMCGISEPNVAGDEELSEILHTVKVTNPMTTFSSDGTRRTTLWKYGYKDYKLMLVDGSPNGTPGFYLNLLQVPAER